MGKGLESDIYVIPVIRSYQETKGDSILVDLFHCLIYQALSPNADVNLMKYRL